MTPTNKAISAISTLIVLCLAGVAFVLSFDALRTLAAANGVAPALAVLFPLAVDGFILAAALAALRANLSGERAVYPTVLVAVFTAVSVVLNVAHSNGVLAIPRPILATIVAIVPPLALMLALELVFAQIRSYVKASASIAALGDIQAEIDDLAEKRQRMLDNNKRLRTTGANLAQRIKERQEELDELARAPQSAQDALLVFYADNPRATHEEAGASVGRSRQWVGPALAKLEAAGRIRRNNGSGVEVLARNAQEVTE